MTAPPAIEQVLMVRAVYIAPEEAIVTAKVHPAPHRSVAELSQAMDQIDAAMRLAVPEVADVYLDVTT